MGILQRKARMLVSHTHMHTNSELSDTAVHQGEGDVILTAAAPAEQKHGRGGVIDGDFW